MIMYIAGPMSGKPGYNHALFNQVAEHLRKVGHVVLNPARQSPKLSYRTLIRMGMVDLCEAECIVLLEGWEQSKGALAELHTARALDLLALEYRFNDGLHEFQQITGEPFALSKHSPAAEATL